MNAAETSASSAIADWTPLAVVSRSLTTAEIDTFISDVSTTSTNIAMARRRANRGIALVGLGRVGLWFCSHGWLLSVAWEVDPCRVVSQSVSGLMSASA